MSALAKLYRGAAEVLDDHAPNAFTGACDAIAAASRALHDGVADGPELKDSYMPMSEMYESDAVRAGPWGGFWGANFGAETPDSLPRDLDLKEAKQCRVLMLLFMSAMAEAGDI